MRPIVPARQLLNAAYDLEGFSSWLCADAERLIDSAELLGGSRWRDRAIETCSAVLQGTAVHDLADDLSALHRLLSLELVDDLDSDEAWHFLHLDPADPRADNARLCAEALELGLHAMLIVAAARTQEAA